jgi:molybdate transport system substrate-binding protein
MDADFAARNLGRSHFSYRDMMRPCGSWSFVRVLGRAAVWSATMLAVFALGLTPSASAELRVFSSGAPAEVAKVLAARFAETTGHRIVFTVGTVREIQAKLSAAEKPDVVILPTAAIEALDKARTLAGSSRADLARVGIGVAIRAGANLPDISTADAVRKALLEARSIVHADPRGGGFAGAHIARVMAQLGIAEAVTPKVTFRFAIAGGLAGVAKGDAEIGLYNISEILAAKGVTLVGPLPPELQSYIAFSGAAHGGSTSPEAALSLLRSLSAKSARDAWQSGGFEPLGQGP